MRPNARANLGRASGFCLAEVTSGKQDADTFGERDRRKVNMGLGNLGDLSNLDLGQLQQYLPNMDFPAGKDQVVSEVQNNGAPQEVIDGVKNSGTETFNSADEVLQAVRGNQ
jgi:Protein of unknown function (DUF2795)